ncbi:MAG: alanine racemase [Gemmatimonadetes bacterium]|nr:alanine racemase [Gemmatimonadota bacterium]
MSRLGPWLDVDLGALVRNARAYARAVGVPLLPMVKANGYGLGAVPVALALDEVNPWGFGVATLTEAETLRRAGIDRPIIAFIPMRPEQVDECLAVDARPVLGSIAALEAWTSRTDRPFHVEIDTGMGRSGFRWHDADALGALRARLPALPGWEGIFTHFSSSDTSAEVTATQWTRFESVLGELPRRPALVHAANSAAGQWGPRYAGNLARPGIFLYGGRAGQLTPEPVAWLQAVVHAVRPIRRGDPVSYGETWRAPEDGEVITLGIGYADGVLRSLSNRGLIGLGVEAFRISGRVTMDMVMVVTPPGRARVGDVATVFGGPIGLDDQADRAETISYELLTAVGHRVARRYGGEP